MRISVSFISVCLFACLLILSVSCSQPTAPRLAPEAPRDAGPGEIALFGEFLGVAKSIIEADKTPEGVTSRKFGFFGFDPDGHLIFSKIDGYDLTGGGSSGFSGKFSITREFLHAAVRKNDKILVINSRQLPVKGKTITFYINGVGYRYRIPSDSYTLTPKTAETRWYRDLSRLLTPQLTNDF